MSPDEVIMPVPVLVGRSEAKLAQLAAMDSGVRWTTNLDEAMADKKNIIYFDAQTTGRRAEAVKKAIALGKHVYCEKPTAVSTESALELYKVAKAAGVKNGVVQDKLWLPGMLKIKRLKEQGFFGNILKLKNIFAEKLNGLFSEPHASFMAGLLLGSRKGIPEALMVNFNATGLTHIIAISGYNITLIIVLVSAMLGFLSRNKKIFFSIIFVILFVVFVGMSAAVVRAAIMGIIGLLALWFGRIYFVELSLLLAAFFMTLWNPKVLVYDVGFQLSCLATAGLIYCPEKIQSWFRWLPNSFGIREAMTMTVAAQIFALPVIVGTFERFSVIAPIANVFVLPFIPLAMVFGFFAVMFGFLSGFLGVVIGFCGYLILETVIFLVNFFAGLPLASIQITWWKWGISSLYYLLIVYVFIVCKKTEI